MNPRFRVPQLAVFFSFPLPTATPRDLTAFLTPLPVLTPSRPPQRMQRCPGSELTRPHAAASAPWHPAVCRC